MIFLDLETYSETPINNGTYVYAADCEVTVLSWAINEGPVRVLDLTDPVQAKGSGMQAFLDAVTDPIQHTLVAHQAMFDRNALRLGNLKLDLPVERWRCSMVRAMAHGLPGGLEAIGDILGISADKRKLKQGKDLVKLFCKPRPKNVKLRRATRHTHPIEWARFLEYARLDIEAMREIWNKLPEWNYKGRELDLWHLDQRINDRGFAIDLDLVDAAIRATDREQARLAEECNTATGGVVASTTKRDQLLAFLLADHGVSLPDMQGATLERRLADPELPDGVRELLANRLQASSTSTAKYRRIKKGTSSDGRIRGTLQFDGAQRTRRAAGRLIQPQNLPSRGLLPQEEVELGIEAMKLNCEHLIFPDVMKLTTSAIRGCIVAPKGKKLLVADLSNIEGRDAAWLAGEDWKLQAFRDFDNGSGPDLYKLSYARSFRVEPDEVDKDERQIGKVQELFFQYEGGVGAYITGADTYGIDLDEMAERAWPALPAVHLHEAESYYQWVIRKNRNTYGLTEKAFVTCDTLKRAWRGNHPKIVTLWKELEEAAIEATNYPGKTIDTRGTFKVRRDGAWLRIGMPSGRALCYPSPRVDDGKLTYMGVNQYTRQWCRLHTHGGKLFENICQSFARDVLYDAMPTMEGEGYAIVLHVHDEVVCEVPDSEEFTLDRLCAILATPPGYAESLPLAAEGFETYRYRKG